MPASRARQTPRSKKSRASHKTIDPDRQPKSRHLRLENCWRHKRRRPELTGTSRYVHSAWLHYVLFIHHRIIVHRNRKSTLTMNPPPPIRSISIPSPGQLRRKTVGQRRSPATNTPSRHHSCGTVRQQRQRSGCLRTPRNADRRLRRRR